MSPSMHQWAVEQLAILDVPVIGMKSDSRAIQRGDTFVAYPGERSDGRKFIQSAIDRGASAVIYEQSWSEPAGKAQQFVWNREWVVPHLAVDDLQYKSGWLADAAYGRPSEKLWVVGITGTNGKTSTSQWISRALSEAGKRCAVIGTLGNGFIDELAATGNTTPDAVQIHGLMAEYLRQGAQAVALEVSSHALSQGRVNAVRFDVAMLTNLSRDHLDYHGDMQSYADSKRKLFEGQQLRFIVLNLDDAFGLELAGQLRDAGAEIVAYGLNEGMLNYARQFGLRMVYGKLIDVSGQGLKLSIHSSWGTTELESQLLGRFNAENLLGVLAVLLVSGVSMADAVRILSKVQPVTGRMQRLGGKNQPTVVVDYAHTPDALEKVLHTLREAVSKSGGKLYCVFGCGGDRDRGKRVLMGRVANDSADFSIVTSDNPRSEDAARIIAEIVVGMDAGKYEVMADRFAAIHRAMGYAKPNDTVLIAGKGHEHYQEIGGVRHPFSDVSVAQQLLASTYPQPVMHERIGDGQ